MALLGKGTVENEVWQKTMERSWHCCRDGRKLVELAGGTEETLAG